MDEEGTAEHGDWSVNEALVVLRATDGSVPFQTKYLRFKDGDEMTLGRTHPNKNISHHSGLFPASASSVSGNHAVLKYVDSKFFLTDLSHNGTFVNGRKLRKNKLTLLNVKTVEVSLGIMEKDKCRVAVFILWALPEGDNDIKYVYKLIEDYSVECNFYVDLPSNISIGLEEMNELVKNRFTVLQEIDDFSFADLQDPAIRERFLEKVKNFQTDAFHLLTLFNHFLGDFESKYKSLLNDNISHCLLLLSACNNRARKFWFIDQESKVWIVKWSYFSESEKLYALSEFGVTYEEVDDLLELHQSYDIIDVREIHFRVPFEDASSVINDRTVVLIRGVALVPLTKMIFVVLKKFKHKVLNNMDNFRRHVGRFWADERLRAVFNFVKNRYRSKYESSYDVKITPSELAKQVKSFPLCMSELKHYLEEDKHLHNGGRFQYGLFLKKIGLTMYDAMIYFREYFTKKMSFLLFNKHYAYGIRHIYGQEGRRVSYDPLSCRKILNKVIEPFRHDGCPFKVLSVHKLSDALSRNNVSKSDADTLWNIAHEMDNGIGPQKACAKYFEIVHSKPYGEPVVEHPNDYFERSRKICASTDPKNQDNCNSCPSRDNACSW